MPSKRNESYHNGIGVKFPCKWFLARNSVSVISVKITSAARMHPLPAIISRTPSPPHNLLGSRNRAVSGRALREHPRVQGWLIGARELIKYVRGIHSGERYPAIAPRPPAGVALMSRVD